jgi:calcium-translocating P-type ATPase
MPRHRTEPRSASRGLTSEEAAERLQRHGPNSLPAAPPPPVWRVLGRQMIHFFAIMLWVAGMLAFIARMPQLGIAIFVVIIVNGFFAFAQEHRAERAAERLRDLLPRRVTVRRDDRLIDVDADGLVVDDLVVLRPGDRISADLMLTDAHSLQIDTSTLTGESVPLDLDVGETGFAGTFVVKGAGEGIVVATGGNTRLAAIARLTRAGQRPPSPLARELDRVVRTIAAVALGVGVAFFVIALLIGTPASDGFLFAIGVTVALVPEGLLPTLTLALAIGAQRMAHRRALVRRLESVETLGSTTYICTDKTGTLTRNEMTVVEIWTPNGTAIVTGEGYAPDGLVQCDPAVLIAIRELARVAARCSDGRAVLENDRWVAQGDPMEAALDVLARKLGIDLADDERAMPLTRQFPFDPDRRRMSIVAGDQLLVKGAPDALFHCCRTPIEEPQRTLNTMADKGLRVIAVASRSAADVTGETPAEEAEQDLDLLGLIALEDPPRGHAAGAIAACREAGIRVSMITGDHPATARAIAREVGLLGPDEMVLEGSQLPKDEAILGALLDRDGVVVSRVSPEEKLRIARALRARGHVVAMTGDGVNDGPALQEADIGIAMGRSGTDVAREAADLVLLDDDFATIVAAIEQGRATFSNIRRFLTYHLTDNVAELTPFVVWALSGGRFPLALGVLQILALDIGTDLLPALALGAETPKAGVLHQPPTRGHLIDRSLLSRVFGVLGPTEAIVEMTAFVVALMAAGWRPGDVFPTGHALLAASGAAFSAVVLGQVGNAFACRSAVEWPGRLGWRSNPLLLVAVFAELLILLACLFVPPIASLLHQAPPPLAGVLVALLAIPTVLLVDVLHKHGRSSARAALQRLGREVDLPDE